jgi:hypothetical protein
MAFEHSPLNAQIEQSTREGRFLLAVVALDTDIGALLHDYGELTAHHAVRATDRPDGSTLRSISLTHRPGAVDPFYDGNATQFDSANNKLFEEAEFSVFNEELIGTEFHRVYRRLPFGVGRMRINLLPSGTAFPMHIDSAPRAHLALETDKRGSFLMSQTGEAYHVPVDGNAYIFDTRLEHTAFNAMTQDRVHLTAALSDFER